jgi:hypothetical protein
MLWIWPLTATALLLPHALRLFRILNALFWTSYPLASDVSLSLHCYAFTACRIPQDLEEPRRLNQYPRSQRRPSLWNTQKFLGKKLGTWIPIIGARL